MWRSILGPLAREFICPFSVMAHFAKDFIEHLYNNHIQGHVLGKKRFLRIRQEHLKIIFCQDTFALAFPSFPAFEEEDPSA